MYEEIRGFSLKNKGVFYAHIRCNSIEYQKMSKGDEHTLDLAGVTGIKEGDIVYFEAVVDGGYNKTIKERFIYRKASDKRACYTISGSTLDNELTYYGIEKYFDKTMYAYINNYPEDRENGWSHEANGVCHDDKNWFFTQDGNLWKFPITHDLNKGCNDEDKSNNILLHKTSFHLGDLDYYKGYLFVPVTGTGEIKGKISNEVLKTERDKNIDKSNRNLGKPQIFVFRADDLSYVRSIILRQKDGDFFEDVGWLAINPNNGLLYTSSGNTPFSFLHVFSIGSLFDEDMLKLHSTLVLYDENSVPLYLYCMQGGCFDNGNYLHLLNGYVTNDAGLNPSKSDLTSRLNSNGISVFKVPKNPNKGKTNSAVRIAHSGQSGTFKYQFDGTGDEPEGITYWDIDKAKIELSKKLHIEENKIAPNIEGQLHAIMLNNAGIKDDDLFFKHYRRIIDRPESPKAVKPEQIRYISLKLENDGKLEVSIKINGASGSYIIEQNIGTRQEKTIDLADVVGKIEEGDVVWLEAIAHDRVNKRTITATANRPFIYQKTSGKKAKYTIITNRIYTRIGKGSTRYTYTNRLEYNGTEGSNGDYRTPKQIRYISLMNRSEFVTRIRIKGALGSYDVSQDICNGQEKTIDLANAVGIIKDGDVVWLEVVVKGDSDITAKQRFVFRKNSEKRVCYSIKTNIISKKKNRANADNPQILTTLINSLSYKKTDKQRANLYTKKRIQQEGSLLD